MSLPRAERGLPRVLGFTTVIPLLRAAIHYPASIFHSSLPQMQISLSVVYIRFSNIWKSSYLEESAEARNMPDPSLPKPALFLPCLILGVGHSLCSHDTRNSLLGKELLGLHTEQVSLSAEVGPIRAMRGSETAPGRCPPLMTGGCCFAPF